MPLTQIINYDVPGNFTFDPVKVEVVGGVAKLKLLELDEDFNEDFASDAGFTYDSGKTEFVGGAMRQAPQLQSGETFRARFNTAGNFDALYAAGVATGTPANGAVVTGGKLELLGATANKYVDYAGAGNADSGNVGAIRFKLTPNYSGAPSSDTQFFVSLGESEGSNNNAMAVHQDTVSGNIRIAMTDSAGVSHTQILGAWSPVAGVEYEFELNWNTNAGVAAQRLFINGVQFGVTRTEVFNRTATGIMRLGNTAATVGGAASFQANFRLDDVQVFSTVQHTASYTPVALADLYTIDVITLPSFAHVGPLTSTFKSFDGFSTIESAVPRYTIKVDAGSDLYWNGSAWVASSNTYATASPKADVLANIAAIPGADGSTTVTAKVYWPSSDVRNAVSDLNFETVGQTTYPVDNPTIRPVAGISADAFLAFASVLSAVGGDEVRWTISADGVLKWWDGAAWANSNGTIAETSIAADVNAHAVQLAISGGVTLKPVAHLHSDDGSTTPDLTSATFDYSFFVVAEPAPNTCVVYGWILNLDGMPRVGATVRVQSWKFEHGAYVVNFFAEVVTDASGYWEMNIVETETLGIRPYEIFVDHVRIARDAQVPDALSASFDTLTKRFVAA
jgi:hypothetical protein